MEEYHLLLHVRTYCAACASIQVLCMCVRYECINNDFFVVVYEVLVDKKDKCSVLIHSSTPGLKKKSIAKNLLN